MNIYQLDPKFNDMDLILSGMPLEAAMDFVIQRHSPSIICFRKEAVGYDWDYGQYDDLGQFYKIGEIRK